VRGVLRALRASHARAQWPLRIETAPQLPRLDNGKVDSAALGRPQDRAVAWDQRI
jgi:hypothetical protein